MAKRKRRSAKKYAIKPTRNIVYDIRRGPIVRPTLKKFLIDEPAIYVRRTIDKKISKPAPIKVTEKPLKLYSGFQREERVISCDQKRERRRRAFFGYLNAPHAGKGAAKKIKSPRSDRFTVKC